MMRQYAPRSVRLLLAVCVLFCLAPLAIAHGVAERDAAMLTTNQGQAMAIYAYLGAKHMVTGIDHLLFLAGVIFFLYRLRDVALYATLFAIGHSVTLLAGVLGDLHANPYLVDAVIGLSVVWKALDNMGGLDKMTWMPGTRVAVLVFGLFHGLGLATKLQALTLAPEGLVANILSFNVGVEIGQILALAFMLIGFTLWRRTGRFAGHALAANWLLLTAGILLTGYQMTGYIVT